MDLKELRRVALYVFNSHQRKDKDEPTVVINNFESIYCSYNLWRSENQLNWSFHSSGYSSLVISPLPAAAGASITASAILLINNLPEMSQTLCTGKRADMLLQVAIAVGFLSTLLRTWGCVSEQRLQVFSRTLQEALTEHYKHHWFPGKPSKGSGY